MELEFELYLREDRISSVSSHVARDPPGTFAATTLHWTPTAPRNTVISCTATMWLVMATMNVAG